MTVVATVVEVFKTLVCLEYRAFMSGELLALEVELNPNTKKWKVGDLVVIEMKLMEY